MARRVLITDQVFGGTHIERGLLEPLGVEVVEAPEADEATLVRLAAGVEAMLVCYARITDAVLEAAAPTCRVLARYGIGFDNVPVATATRLGIVVTNVPDYCLDEVADHAMALLLAVARGIAFLDREVRQGAWEVPKSGIHRLTGRRLALLGVGRIGRRVAGRARAFGLEVAGYDPYLQEWDLPGVARAETLEEALGEASFVSLHVPLTEENRHLIGERTIPMMRRSPAIINTARGPLVDLDAVTAALDAGSIGALALDVTEPEPLPVGHPLWAAPNLLLTPHVAGAVPDTNARAAAAVTAQLQRVLAGEPLLNVVDGY